MVSFTKEECEKIINIKYTQLNMCLYLLDVPPNIKINYYEF